ncbi:MAG: phosphate signaling complex protein PhoU, partial [Steroidobacteraceae bacterium]
MSVDSPPTPEGHASKSLEQGLARLRLEMLAMGGLVIDQVAGATEAFVTGDRARAETVLSREPQVNGYDVVIDEHSERLLAYYQPLAIDLRLVRAITRAAIDLERAGDEARKIARTALRVQAPESRKSVAVVTQPVRQMADIGLAMLRDAVVALDTMNAELADHVRRRDKEMDAEFEAAVRRLTTITLESSDAMPAVLDIVLALKALERIGDHAKNVAEQVVFI